MQDQGGTLLSLPRSTDKRLDPISPTRTFDIFLSLNLNKDVGVTSHLEVEKPLQTIMFTCKKEAEYSYVTLSNNYNWAFKKVFICYLFAF